MPCSNVLPPSRSAFPPTDRRGSVLRQPQADRVTSSSSSHTLAARAVAAAALEQLEALTGLLAEEQSVGGLDPNGRSELLGPATLHAVEIAGGRGRRPRCLAGLL